ncbi:MAG TPA: hypothetical protein VE973_02850 [Candidatus Limnocylindria bacterium]|nr:hypothetical protein [Candidatus Limnocylindria bacterium]
MNKLFLASAAVVLLAAGCSSQTSMNESTNSDQVPASQSASTQTQVNVKVNNADDAVNLMEQSSTNEQSQVSAGDDSDLSSSDSADLNSLTEVQNGY